jgi:hypothetical protein
MPYCYYTCNLLPLDLVAHVGYSPVWLGNRLRDAAAPARREALSIHPMTCPCVTKLVAAAEEVLGADLLGSDLLGGGDAPGDGTPSGDGARAASNGDCLVVPGGCDAMRRMGDLMAANYPGRVFVLPVPRSSGPEVTKALAADLRRLEDWLGARLPAGAARVGAAAGNTPVPLEQEPPALDYPSPPQPGGVFLVAGPLSNDSLLRLIGRLGAGVAGLDSCTSPDRWRPLAAGGGAPAGAVLDHATLAARLLEFGMCPRRSTADRRDHLARRLDETHPSSVIYARQSFCDPGAYDALLVAQLAEERTLPYLEIEVDFPFDANGPLHTRVEAFLEAQLLDDDLLGDPGDEDLFDGSPSGRGTSASGGED